MSAVKGIDYTKRIDQITEEVLQEMEELYELGMYDRHIYDYFCIPSRTFQYWKNRGRKIAEKLEAGEIAIDDLVDDEVTYLRILLLSKKGRSKMIKRNLEVIRNAGQDGTWQASAWKLERADNKAFGRKEIIKVEAKIKINEDKMKKLDEIFNDDDQSELDNSIVEKFKKV